MNNQHTLQSRKLASVFTGDSHYANYIIIIFFASTITLFFLFTSTNYFAGGAGSFLEFADAIVTGKHTARIVQRDIGFPLLLILTGFPFTDSLYGIIAAHSLMAVLIPTGIYAALQGTSPRIALLAAMTCILSLAPFLAIKLIYHDQLYIFLTMLSALSFLYYVRSGRPLILYATSLILLVTSFTRPAGNGLFILLIIFAWLAHRLNVKHCVTAAILFASIVYASHEYRRFIMSVPVDAPTPSYMGLQIFYNLYVNSSDYGVKLSPELGPTMKNRYERVEAQFSPIPAENPLLIAYGQLNPDLYREWLTVYDPKEFAQRIFKNPIPVFFEIIENMETICLDNNFWLHASWEIVRANPLFPIQYTIRNLAAYFFYPGYMHIQGAAGTRQNSPLAEFTPALGGVSVEPGLTDRAIQELSYVPLDSQFAYLKDAFTEVEVIWATCYDTINLITITLAIVAVIGATAIVLLYFINLDGFSFFVVGIIGNRNRVVEILGLSTVIFYNAAVTAAFAEPIYRYHYMTVPIQIICGGFGLSLMVSLFLTLLRWANNLLNYSHRNSVSILE
jgi:hypothetical protein